MQRKRLKHIEVYHIVGILCLVAGLGLFTLSIYILPHLALGWHYVVPDFVSSWRNNLQESYQITEKGAAWFIFLGLFLLALFFSIIADIISNRVEKKFFHLEEINFASKTRQLPSHDRESNFLVLKIVLIILLVFVAAQFFQWIISTPSTRMG